jgi:bifunctional N-acetylglucosamine-1-phosphate-uridyltransferase/glucosamine-1-phosphate-acetyltransferase GlmU-like protein
MRGCVPGTELAEETHIGNFVELKNAQVGFNSKINHLSYVGDATVGARSTSAPAPSPAITMAPTSTAR